MCLRLGGRGATARLRGLFEYVTAVGDPCLVFMVLNVQGAAATWLRPGWIPTLSL
jgi:hypothetical protein